MLIDDRHDASLVFGDLSEVTVQVARLAKGDSDLEDIAPEDDEPGEQYVLALDGETLTVERMVSSHDLRRVTLPANRLDAWAKLLAAEAKHMVFVPPDSDDDGADFEANGKVSIWLSPLDNAERVAYLDERFDEDGDSESDFQVEYDFWYDHDFCDSHTIVGPGNIEELVAPCSGGASIVASICGRGRPIEWAAFRSVIIVYDLAYDPERVEVDDEPQAWFAGVFDYDKSGG